ncbi:hypothetical protein [Arthrobacter sp. 179]|uniref:hypothetical protein n=1 Tax=Arthrobacter sp. 179 TaxID=3457734 RepID=UPI004033FE41
MPTTFEKDRQPRGNLVLSLDTAHWQDIVGQLLDRTRTRAVIWSPISADDDEAEWTWGFSCRFTAGRTRFSLRNNAAESAFESCVRRLEPGGHEFSNTLRVNAEGAKGRTPLKELHEAVADEVAFARRLSAVENASITFRQLVDAIQGIEPGEDYLSAREFEDLDYHGHFDFDSEQWHAVVDALYDRTLDGSLVWDPVGTPQRRTGQYVALLPAEISIGLIIDEANEYDERGPDGRFYQLRLLDTSLADEIEELGDLKKNDAIHACEDADMKDEQLAHCTATLDALHDLLCHDLVIQENAFRAIALEETFRSIMASIEAGSDQAS